MRVRFSAVHLLSIYNIYQELLLIFYHLDKLLDIGLNLPQLRWGKRPNLVNEYVSFSVIQTSSHYPLLDGIGCINGLDELGELGELNRMVSPEEVYGKAFQILPHLIQQYPSPHGIS